MRVFVENLEFVGFHGLYEDERRDGRNYRVSIWADVTGIPEHDGIEETLDYRRLAEVVTEVGVDSQSHLVETLATSMLDRILERYREVSRCGVTIRKQATGVAGNPEFVGVTLEKGRNV